MVGGDSPVARPRGCRPRGGYVAGYRAGVPTSIAAGREPAAHGCAVVADLATARLRQTRRVLQRPPAGTIPDAPGSYQFRDRDGRVIYVGKAKSLRSRLSNYFQNPANLPPRTAQMVAQAETRRVDPGPQRRRSHHARVQPDQAAQAPLQRPAAGRQELPVPGRHGERRVAPGHGAAGDQGQGQPLLRALRPRLRHPGDARLAAADVPDPHLQRQQVPQPPAARAALPALPHREVLGSVHRSEIDHDDYGGLVDELVDFLDGDTQPVLKRLEAEMHEAVRRASSSSGPAGSATG